MNDAVTRRRFRNEFVRDIWIASIAAAETPEALDTLRELLFEAWSRADPLAFLPPMRRLHAARRLTPKMALRMAVALLDLRLADEALEVLSEGPPPEGRQFDWSMARARATLASGLAGVASDAVAAALEAATDDGQRNQAQGLRELIDLPSGPDMAAASDPTLWVWRCLLEDQPVQASMAFERLLSSLSLKAGGRQRRAVLEAAFAILRTGDPAIADRVLTAMWGLFAFLGGTPELRPVLARLHGRELSRRDGETQIDPLTQLFLRSCLAEACAAARLWPEAIQRFERSIKTNGYVAENLCEMARCVGRDVLSAHPLRLAKQGRPQVIDLFPFNGEFLMLELKLTEMSPWVDRFVLVEAGQTFTGNPKPLHFAENRERFAAWADKIDYVPIERFADYLNTPWAREFHQRDMAVSVLSGRCGPEDVVIISDVDEIVRETAVRELTGPVAISELRLFNYFFNHELISKGPRPKTVFARAGVLAGVGASYLRLGMARFLSAEIFIPNGGWHFSAVGSVSDLRRKFTSFSHTELRDQSEQELAEKLALARAGQYGEDFRVCDLEDDMPAFLRDNRDRLGDFLI